LQRCAGERREKKKKKKKKKKNIRRGRALISGAHRGASLRRGITNVHAWIASGMRAASAAIASAEQGEHKPSQKQRREKRSWRRRGEEEAGGATKAGNRNIVKTGRASAWHAKCGGLKITATKRKAALSSNIGAWACVGHNAFAR